MPTNNKQNLKQKTGQHCGVPHCNSYRSGDVSVHRIMNNPKELMKWRHALKMGKEFPKYFGICSLHFKKGQILVPIARGQKQRKSYLLESAFPTLNLPKSSIATKQCITKIKARYERLIKRRFQKERYFYVI